MPSTSKVIDTSQSKPGFRTGSQPQEFASGSQPLAPLYAEGYEAGFAAGRQVGFETGFDKGFQAGRKAAAGDTDSVVSPRSVSRQKDNASVRRLLGLPCTQCGAWFYSDESFCPRCKAPKSVPEDGPGREPQ